MRKRLVRGPEDIADLIGRLGFLPFFRNEIRGFSLEEHTPPELWWNEEDDIWPCWEWKGEVISLANCGYGKYAFAKMCFVSEEWFPDFRNYRISRRRITEDEALVLETLRGEDSLLTKELKSLAGYRREERRISEFSGGLEAGAGPAIRPVRREGFDTVLSHLQRDCRVTISGFEYAVDRYGNRYGWGIARYTTPESFFGGRALDVARTPEESRERILGKLRSDFPRASLRALERFAG